jgi:hypothetical protein
MAQRASKIDQARAWLQAELSDGQPHVAGGILTRATQAGFTEQTIRRAAKSLQIKEFSACMGYRVVAGLVMLWKLSSA